jgi:galactokinase
MERVKSSELKDQLFKLTGEKEHPLFFRAPGRVNLIGEHTDYNDGFVLPIAINLGLRAAVLPSDSPQVRVRSLLMKETRKFFLNQLNETRKTNTWLDYLQGVGLELRKEGHKLKGFQGIFASNLPVGSGLSSSGALEVLTELIFESTSGFGLASLEAVKLCRRAENHFVGVDCGIMDQFASRFGRAEHAIFIDCRELKHEYVPFPKDYKAVVLDTGVRRELSKSSYNQRRRECKEALGFLKKHYPEVKALRDVSLSRLEKYEEDMPPTLRKRARHVVKENGRVIEAVDLLKRGNLEGFGKLMNDSHRSLRSDYAVSSKELDKAVNIARGLRGCAGSRLTGAGFGGSTVSLVETTQVKGFIGRIEKLYSEATGFKPKLYVCEAADGAKRIK